LIHRQQIGRHTARGEKEQDGTCGNRAHRLVAFPPSYNAKPEQPIYAALGHARFKARRPPSAVGRLKTGASGPSCGGPAG
jgi:hypothetical protein